MRRGDSDGALASNRAGLALREDLARRDRGSAVAQVDLAISHHRLGGLDQPRVHGEALLAIVAELRPRGVQDRRLAGLEEAGRRLVVGE